MFENRGNIERKIDMAIGQRDRGDIAVHLDQLRLDPFVAEEALLERNFHREPKHTHSGIGKRDFARIGTVPPIGLPEDEDDQLR